MGLREIFFFFKEAAGSFSQTGAVLPSSPALARALAEEIRSSAGPQRVLEIGGGTGVLTRELLRTLPPGSLLDIAEINPRFADWLEERILAEPGGVNARVLRGDFLEMDLEGGYDHVISALPFNNLEPGQVDRLLSKALSLLTGEGTMAWFEYGGIRVLKNFFSSKSRRERTRGVGVVTQRYIRDHGAGDRFVLRNFPPAVVHRMRSGAGP